MEGLADAQEEGGRGERRLWGAGIACLLGGDLIALLRLALGDALPGSSASGDAYGAAATLLFAGAGLLSALWLLGLLSGRIGGEGARKRAGVLLMALAGHAIVFV